MNSTIEIDPIFDLAKQYLKSLADLGLSTNPPPNFPTISLREKLLSYAYYKQATKGSYTGKMAGFNKSVKDLKAIEWKRLGSMSSLEAKYHYCQLAKSILTLYSKLEIEDISEYLLQQKTRDRDR